MGWSKVRYLDVDVDVDVDVNIDIDISQSWQVYKIYEESRMRTEMIWAPQKGPDNRLGKKQVLTNSYVPLPHEWMNDEWPQKLGQEQISKQGRECKNFTMN